MQRKFLIIGILAFMTLALYFVGGYQQVTETEEEIEDSAWHKQVEAKAAQWAASPQGKQALAEQENDRKLFQQAQKNVLERHGKKTIGDGNGPPPPEFTSEIMKEMHDLREKAEKKQP